MAVFAKMTAAEQALWLALWLRHCPSYFDGMKELMDRSADTIERLQKAFDDDQEVLKGLEQERDAALAEVERLKGELNDRSDEMKTRRSEAFFSGYVASKQAR